MLFVQDNYKFVLDKINSKTDNTFFVLDKSNFVRDKNYDTDQGKNDFFFHETLQSICGLLSVRGKLVLISSSGFCFKFPRLSPLNIGFFAKTPPISRLMLSFSFHSPDYIWLRCRSSTPKKIFSVFRTV